MKYHILLFNLFSGLLFSAEPEIARPSKVVLPSLMGHVFQGGRVDALELPMAVQQILRQLQRERPFSPLDVVFMPLEYPGWTGAKEFAPIRFDLKGLSASEALDLAAQFISRTFYVPSAKAIEYHGISQVSRDEIENVVVVISDDLANEWMIDWKQDETSLSDHLMKRLFIPLRVTKVLSEKKEIWIKISKPNLHLLEMEITAIEARHLRRKLYNQK